MKITSERWKEFLIAVLVFVLAFSLRSNWRSRHDVGQPPVDDVVFTRLYDTRLPGGLRVVVLRDEIYGCEYVVTTCGTSIDVCRRGFAMVGK